MTIDNKMRDERLAHAEEKGREDRKAIERLSNMIKAECARLNFSTVMWFGTQADKENGDGIQSYFGTYNTEVLGLYVFISNLLAEPAMVAIMEAYIKTNGKGIERVGELPAPSEEGERVIN